jgi:DNA primase
VALDSGPNHFGFPTDFKEQVRSRTDLVALIGESVALTSRGPHDFVGLCPFHDDHNPSFHVYPDRQSYRCWVCDEGGDCFSFVMKYDRLGFREALEMLAERAGLELPQTVRRFSPEQKDRRTRLYEIVAWAEALCHDFLLEDRSAEPAREYLRSRGFTGETMKAFRLGFHPHNGGWLLGRGRLKKYTAADLASAGLARQRDDGSFYDDPLFHGRVLFPIRDLRGRIVAFGGRVLPQDDKRDGKKYLNSAENELFTKSRLLYAFDESRQAIREAKSVVVMEGYTDCITAHQCGVKNVVATLGTCPGSARTPTAAASRWSWGRRTSSGGTCRPRSPSGYTRKSTVSMARRSTAASMN